ncbi:MATE family efflux transporter [Paenibacillus sp. 19GGS1-52]|uniref:MATE family efflux transporter n=1 Tax=Paenibacillus sp. 19GGS1-52 TaxID=2758563 RepID=UPI001EFBD2EE|nr:MATE family efflux transporter [Paenibacillus sp. 19GGS1-52]ULO06301.1 MATE family efflux transporter [Paenibacillus sp. 19GGS1-52]
MNALDMQFRKDMKRLVIPSILQMLLGNSFSLINTLMVGGLGDTAIAITAAVGQISFILGMLLTAIYGISAYITQFFGKEDFMNVKKSFGLMLISSLILSSIVFMLVSMFKGPLISLFIKDEAAIAYGIHYLSVIAFVFLINAIKDVYSNALGSIGKVKLTLIVGIMAMFVNILLDYALIYGKFGFPRYGIVGAAWSSLVSSMLSAIILLGYVYWNKYYFNVTLTEILSIRWPFIREIYRTTLPLLFHEGLWSVGNMLYAIAFGHLGVAALATYQLALTFNGYFMIGIFGFAYAARVMIGEKLSQVDSGEYLIYARKFTRIALYSGVIVGALILLLNPYIVYLFPNISVAVQTSFRNVMVIQAVVMIMFFLNNLWIVGMFRAGGDNLYTMKLILVTTWLIALPLVFAGVYIFHLSVEIVYMMFVFEEVAKAGIGYFRYRSNKWARNLVRNM